MAAQPTSATASARYSALIAHAIETSFAKFQLAGRKIRMIIRGALTIAESRNTKGSSDLPLSRNLHGT
jgi:hypothetical protein